jgi:hypothetical protein
MGAGKSRSGGGPDRAAPSSVLSAKAISSKSPSIDMATSLLDVNHLPHEWRNALISQSSSSSLPFHTWPVDLVDIISSYIAPCHYIILFINSLQQQQERTASTSSSSNGSQVVDIYATIVPLTSTSQWYRLCSLPVGATRLAIGARFDHLYIAAIQTQEIMRASLPSLLSASKRSLDRDPSPTSINEWQHITDLPRSLGGWRETCILTDGRWVFGRKVTVFIIFLNVRISTLH